MPDQPLHVLNCADAALPWRWIAPAYSGAPPVDWRFISTHRGRIAASLPGPHWGRVRAGLQARWALALRRFDLVVSHGPRTSHYVEAFGRPRAPHLAWSFNFTDLPGGRRLAAMRASFARIDRFIVFSTMERALYADLFGIPVERFRFVPWGVSAPIIQPQARAIDAPYVAALGGEARDYELLCQAARALPHVRFVIVARPHSLQSTIVPDNVQLFFNLPFAEAWSIVWHSEVAVIPLRDARTPNGHVTLVGSMHLGKAQVVTDSAGVRDYIHDGETGLLAAAHDADAFAAAITRLLDDPSLRTRIGGNARAFAAAHCSEAATIEAFRAQLVELTGRG